MTGLLLSDAFKPLTGTTFSAQAGEDRFELRLDSVTELGAGEQAANRTPFSLIFLGSAERVWPQQTYRLSHESLGVIDVFLVPVGPQGAEIAYEAVYT